MGVADIFDTNVLVDRLHRRTAVNRSVARVV
jgi:hypothetical protein